MATLTTFTAGTPILSADVNANFAAVNTEVAGAMRTGYSSGVSAGNVGGGEDVLHTWSMPAGTLGVAGDGFLIHSWLITEANANIKTFKFYASRPSSGTGGTAFTLNPTTVAPSAKNLAVTIYGVYNGASIIGTISVLLGVDLGTGGAVECAGIFSHAHTAAAVRVVEFTGTSGSSATNDCIQQLTTISLFKAAA